MATLARSFKPPAYLTPRRHPGMAGRTLSNSSELSLTSNTSGRSDDVGDFVSSRPTTPSHPQGPSADEQAPVKSSSNASAVPSPRSTNSRPIAIQIPKVRKMNSAPVYTPPEPLSARGDLPGGYFPMHEDPKTRVHRPHPFHHRATDTSAMHADHMTSQHAPVGSYKAQGANMPVASYMPPGFHDNPLPVGKYYPSNYERRNSNSKNVRAVGAGAVSSSVTSDTQVPTYRPDSSQSTSSEDETRRKMQQYQRDMIMQAALALGNSTANASQLAAGINLNGVELLLASAAPHKPKSPRLVPLGSPGPVTPMELECSGGGYLDKGNDPEYGSRDSLAPPFTEYAASP